MNIMLAVRKSPMSLIYFRDHHQEEDPICTKTEKES